MNHDIEKLIAHLSERQAFLDGLVLGAGLHGAMTADG